MQGRPLSNVGCHFTSSSGLKLDYGYQLRTTQWKIDGKKETLLSYPCILNSVSSPSYRNESLDYSEKLLLSSYLGKGDVFNIVNAPFGQGPKYYRAHKLLLPVGQNDSFEPVYEMSYQPPIAGEKPGSTTVKNSDGTSIVYHFSKDLLTTSIQYFDQIGELKKEKLYDWNEKNRLKSLSMRDGQKNLFYKKTYEYDSFGNPILETFTGDLTGEGTQETLTTKRVFSEDGRHLLLKEETEDGKVTTFSYLPKTNLITSKLIKDGDEILLREFSIYDDCNNLIKFISDNGDTEDLDNLSEVTQRLITTYVLRGSAPFLHMPEWIIETYLENGAEKPLKKRHLNYDNYGNVSEEAVYGAEGVLAYTLYKTYNERGDILSETNSLGRKATYTYDARGHLKTAINFSGRLEKTFDHDTKGRLFKLTETGDDGITHVTSAAYDFQDRKIQKTDPFSNTTHYAYDPLVNEITKTDYPSISSFTGRETPVITSSTYDPFGREISQIDPGGNVTTYLYNVYGSKSAIFHPNGGVEIFRYAKNGTLICHTDPDGLKTEYKRDVFGRPRSKTYTSKEGKLLAEEAFLYNGFNLLAAIDKEGDLKFYFYDGAGRKIREEFCGQITDFNYDSLGRLASIQKRNGANTLVVHYERDLEGRVLEERKTDSSDHLLYKICYSYDADGNQETVTRTINGKKAVDVFFYDSFSRRLQYTDAMGYTSKTTYNEQFVNALGQNVLQMISVDPSNVMTVETKDALHRTVKSEVLNAQGQPISCQEMIHDPQGNMLYQKDHVYEKDLFRTTQIVQYTYTSDHNIETMTRGFGTEDARMSSYTYLPSGKRATKTLPDGITLSYSYHPLGFMSRLDSSDCKIHHAFTYDNLGHLRSALDENQNIAIKRDVDAFGNVKKETFSSGLEVKKEYDLLNRLTYLKMGNQGEILYSYDSLFLKSVTRISPEGKTLYCHTYDSYDEDGNLVSEGLIGNVSHVSHITDVRGQKASISSPYFSQDCSYDALGNLVTSSVDQARLSYGYDDMSQLSSENNLTYVHDSLYNRVQKDDKAYQVNDLNEILSSEEASYSYDLNGNQTLSKTASEESVFTYDPLGQLLEVSSAKKKVQFSYDPLGRRMSKALYTVTSDGPQEFFREYYLYDGQNEIGAFTSSKEAKNLRVLGRASQTVAVEVKDHIFAPLLDVQGNICRLVDLETRSIAASYDFTAFGEELHDSIKDRPLSPWRFASKRQDRELGLIYFGKRYYDPRLGRWLSTDPAGFVDSFNLYQYVLNNPFKYQDPNGENLVGFLIGIGQILLGGAIMASATALEVATGGAYTIPFAIQCKIGFALMASGCAQATWHAQDIKIPNTSWKNTSVYAPDRGLPRDDNTKEPVPDTDVPHTQLGTKKGSKGAYPQAREFDAYGKPVRDIDFTDHGRPQDHTNPHQHLYEPNPTGGTPQRGDPKPLYNWTNYV
jgi:RHS repeat-associated protein